MVWDSNGEPKGYGFITLKAAELAIKKLFFDVMLLNDHLVSIIRQNKPLEKCVAKRNSSIYPLKDRVQTSCVQTSIIILCSAYYLLCSDVSSVEMTESMDCCLFRARGTSYCR